MARASVSIARNYWAPQRRRSRVGAELQTPTVGPLVTVRVIHESSDVGAVTINVYLYVHTYACVVKKILICVCVSIKARDLGES